MQKKHLLTNSIPFHDIYCQLGIEGKYLYIIKAIHEKAIANITLSGEKQKPFFLGLGAGQGCLLLLSVLITIIIIIKE